MANRYPVFTCEDERDKYLDKLIANSYQVKAKTVVLADNRTLHTVTDIDQRKGK